MAGPNQAPNNAVIPQLDVSTPSLNQPAGSESLANIRDQALAESRNPPTTPDSSPTSSPPTNEGHYNNLFLTK